MLQYEESGNIHAYRKSIPLYFLSLSLNLHVCVDGCPFFFFFLHYLDLFWLNCLCFYWDLRRRQQNWNIPLVLWKWFWFLLVHIYVLVFVYVKPKSIFEVTEKHRESEVTVLVRCEETLAMTIEIPKTADRSKSESGNSSQAPVRQENSRYCSMFELSETIPWQKWSGYSLMSAHQPWKGKT